MIDLFVEILGFTKVPSINGPILLPDNVLLLIILLFLATAIGAIIELNKRLKKSKNELRFRSGVLESANRLLEELLAERKKVEQALKESEMTFRTLFEQSTDSLALLDKGIFTDCNHAMLKLLGYQQKNEIIGRSPWDLSPAAQPNGRGSEKLANELIANTLIKGNSRFEWVHTKANGVTFPAEAVLTLFNFKGKDILHVSLRDISLRKRIEKALKQSEENYRLLVENQTDMVVKLDKDGHLLFASPSFCRFIGLEVGEAPGKDFFLFVHQDDMIAIKKEWERLISPPYHTKIVLRVLTQEGWKWVSWTETALRDEKAEVTAIIGVGRDVTNRKETEKLAAELNIKLRNKLTYLKDYFDNNDQEHRIDITYVSRQLQEILSLMDEFSCDTNSLGAPATDPMQ